MDEDAKGRVNLDNETVIVGCIGGGVGTQSVNEIEDTLDRENLEDEKVERSFKLEEREGLRLVGVGGSLKRAGVDRDSMLGYGDGHFLIFDMRIDS